ncbi:phosphoribosylglycinamide formyltransferase [Polymorphobacter fuscus]|uniref:Phosphoribosylglycinamide formyltransferase n=1 Tax=Sandarakinorhabdus fusca TaxID=1439888 RepID=A0A7C9GT62_9SPHN|nr:phosphoribosylglycinamide formyltransferase [Polymorphobacter fuscus]KAB7648715.1 phosphoribosylglycinamide formyltransferase [Polymorphobacter fuscus]MQT16278.1 phosphoribosylglycinamide formyltransferase [Polymorphobacter fuscus]NJC07437.1 formyltetrahydrofolate-dependent phosphoribosylglycinamide formyltransferase [Polymorphobacter fuscus]
MARARVAVLISGRGSNMAALLYASHAPDCPYEIVLVASNVPDAPGLALARAEGVPVFARAHQGLKRAEFDAIIDAELERAEVQYVALAGYMRLLSEGFVASWAGRCLNIHPSLLPLHKGLDVHEAVLAAGETATGCTVHLVTPALDDGPILGQARVAVIAGDTPETLADRVHYAEHQLYPRVLAELVSGTTGVDAQLARVRALALALPEAGERLSHGAPGFFVQGGKFFAYFSHDHHGNGVTGLLVKASGVEEQAQLIENDPELYYRPAYFGPSGWIGIRLDRGAVDWDHIGDWLARSWRASAPKRLAAMLDF